jgi:threonine/homoserine/homoserine lactone efflux protein
MTNYLLFGITYAFACVVQPGPFQAFLLSQSVTNGWRKTIPLVFAPLISDIPVIIVVLLVLKNLPSGILQIFQCAGGLFLLYLAFGAYKTWRTFNPDEKQNIFLRQNFLKALLVSILNPNPYLGWSLVMGPMLIKSWNEAPVNGVILLACFYSTMVICSMGMVVLFAAASNLGPRISRMSIGISAIALVIFAIYQLWSGVTGFMQH